MAATAAYLKAQGEVGDFDKAIKVLHESMQVRSERWITFRKSIATRAKTQFNHFLGQRGYSGGLEIDHHSKKLVVKVSAERRPVILTLESCAHITSCHKGSNGRRLHQKPSQGHASPLRRRKVFLDHLPALGIVGIGGLSNSLPRRIRCLHGRS